MTTEEKTTLPAQGSRRVQDEEELYPGEENALRRGIHGSRPLPHHTRGARSQAPEENKAQQRAAEKTERPARAPAKGTESQRKLYRAGILSDPDLHRHLFAGEHGAGPAGSAQLHPADKGCHRKAVRPRRGAAGDGPDRLRTKERALPPSSAGGVQRTDHAAERGLPTAAGGQVGHALAGRQRGEPWHSQRRPVKSAKQAG